MLTIGLLTSSGIERIRSDYEPSSLPLDRKHRCSLDLLSESQSRVVELMRRRLRGPDQLETKLDMYLVRLEVEVGA